MVERRQGLVATIQKEVLIKLFPHAIHLGDDVLGGLEIRREKGGDSENQLGEEG
jgi:hypothetical protein